MKNIVLASTSQSRKALMQRFQIPFTIAAPNVDETPLVNETAEEMVTRLAKEKAQAVSTSYPNAFIIGADQVGVCEDTILGKPLTSENAIAQLQFLSGKSVKFVIGLALLNTATQRLQVALETYEVYFRQLSLTEIENYINKDQPLQCAGSFHAEGLGITLVEKFSGNDFTALIGLPLIRLTSLFKNENINII